MYTSYDHTNIQGKPRENLIFELFQDRSSLE